MNTASQENNWSCVSTQVLGIYSQEIIQAEEKKFICITLPIIYNIYLLDVIYYIIYNDIIYTSKKY